MKFLDRFAGLVVAAVMMSAAGTQAAETQLPLPDVTVTAPGPQNVPPYLREPGRAASNPYHGRFRVEEDKFVKVPCTQTRRPNWYRGPVRHSTCPGRFSGSLSRFPTQN